MGNIEVILNKSADKEIMEALKSGLKKVGMLAESYAKALAPVDTGLLRNSITFAIGGEMPKTLEYADDDGNGKGSYESTAPSDEDGKVTLYVGTNVHYAPYQELGHMTQKGDWIDPQAVLRPAVENHAEEYHRIMIAELNAIR